MYFTYFYKFRKFKLEDVSSSADFAHIDTLMEFEVGLISSARFLTMPFIFLAQPHVFKFNAADFLMDTNSNSLYEIFVVKRFYFLC